MRRLSLLLILPFILMMFLFHSSADSAIPDFAFPKKVQESSAASFDKAVKSSDWPAALRSLIDNSLAITAIDSETMPAIIGRIDSLANHATDPAYQSMLLSLEAYMLAEFYMADQWNYDRRQSAPGPMPDDLRQWSGNQFRARLVELCNAAMASQSTTPLQLYKASVTHDAATFSLYPTVFDFAAWYSLNLFNKCRLPDAKVLSDEVLGHLKRHNVANPAAGILIDLFDYEVNDSTFSAYRRLYEAHYADTPFSGEILRKMINIASESPVTSQPLNEGTLSTDPDRRWLYDAASEFVKRYPHWERVELVKQVCSELVNKDASVSFPDVIAPSEPVTVSVTLQNVTRATLRLYRLSSSSVRYSALNGLKPIQTIEINVPADAPFSYSCERTFAPVAQGNYTITINSPELATPSPREYCREFECHALAMFDFGIGSNTVVAVDAALGTPVSAASLRTEQGQILGRTASDGMLKLSGKHNETVRVVKGNLTSPTMRLHSPYTQTDSRQAVVLTDLPLYHPGDSVSFTAVIYHSDGITSGVLSGTNVKCILRDANYTEVDTLTLSTDRFGRVSGSFHLPSDRLNGNFSIIVMDNRSYIGQGMFMVSDYKLPTFEIVAQPTAVGTPLPGAATISGSAVSYSGVPLVGARVSVHLTARAMWYVDHIVFEPVDMETVTDAEGRFNLVIPADSLTAGQHAVYTADIMVTAPNGESGQTRSLFTMGPALNINVNMPSAIDLSRPVVIPLSVTDCRGTSVDSTVRYTIYGNDDDNTPLRSGVLNIAAASAPEVTLDLRGLTPGSYRLVFSAQDAADVTVQTIVYRPDSDISPVTTSVWLPVTAGVCPANGRMSFQVASGDGGAVLMIVSDNEKVISTQWLTLRKGVYPATVQVQDSNRDYEVLLVAVRNHRTISQRFAISRARPNRLNIAVSSMRDNVTAGVLETWTFRITDADGSPVSAAMVMDIYNRALDALSRPNFGFDGPEVRKPHVALYYNYRSNGSIWAGGKARMTGSVSLPDLTAPTWQLYGRDFLPYVMYGALREPSPLMARNTAMKLSSARATMAYDDAVMEEAVEESEADTGTGGATQPEQNPQVEYRSLEVALGMFRPNLSTDSEGNLNLTWRVPQANASWAVRALSWVNDMRTARFDSVIVSSKPVMVQPNLPRYLRSGDCAAVLTSVSNQINNSIDAQILVELFDPSTGTVFDRNTRTVSIPPHSTVPVSHQLAADDGHAFIGFRVSAIAGNFTDGVQSVVPVLTASDPVIETVPFWLAPDAATTSVNAPAIPHADSAVTTTVEYCDNPVWYLLTAMPGLESRTPVSSGGALDALFSAVLARHLLDTNPNIAKALKEWSQTSGDGSPLTSMLERNQDLKLMLLNATPWVRQAMSDTERMQRLTMLLDPTNIAAVESGALELLSQLQHSSGALGWTLQFNEPSLWATSQLLGTAARLRTLGMPLPEGMKKMLPGAVRYYDAETLRRSTSAKDVLSASELLRRGSLMRDYPASDNAMASMLKRSASDLAKNWKKQSLYSLPDVALALNLFGYKSTVSQVLESIRQYCVTTPENGTRIPTFENNAYGYISFTANALVAFANLSPDSPEVQGLCHNLVLQKQATEWGGGAGASDAIYAIMTAARKWVRPAGAFSIMVNGAKLAATPSDSILGYVRSELDVADGPVKLEITRTPGTPAWGGLVRRFSAPAATIAPAGCKDLSIRKELLLPDNSDSATVGLKATVRLVIDVRRNMSYVAITDNRAACFEPVIQTPRYIRSEGVSFYLENRDAVTNIFVSALPKGLYILTYEVWLNNAGTFTTGIATVQSQMAPELSTHSGGAVINVKPDNL